jgi:hypothetical protein
MDKESLKILAISFLVVAFALAVNYFFFVRFLPTIVER